MLPDLDSGTISLRRALPRLSGSTVAIMWGPLTCVLAKGVAKISGGHRNGTHSVLGVLVVAMLAFAAARTFPTSVFLLALAIGLALRALAFAIPGRAEETWIINLAVSFGAAWWLLTKGDGSPEWLPLSVVLGCLVHIAGDALTTQGVPVPVLWLLRRSRLALTPLRTGTTLEKVVLVPAFGLATLYCVYLNTDLRAAVDPLLADLPGLG
jgi:membrane-bound metal-dependent hydrolase YbcI (DUF457 family)